MNLTTSLPISAFAALALLTNAATSPTPTPVEPPLAIALQDRDAATADQEKEARPTIAYFQPKRADAGLLRNTVQNLVFTGGILGDIQGGRFQAMILQVVDETIIVSALPDLMPDVLKLLRELDDEIGAVEIDTSDQAIATFQYQLRFASRAAVEKALSPFRNLGPQMAGRSPNEPTGITIVPETGTVVVRESRATIAEIERVLEEIDQPQPQVRLTYYLVRGYSEESMMDEGYEPDQMNQGVPAELVEDLGALLPVAGFRMESFGVLQGDALALREFRDQMGQASMRLSLYPTTFDRQTGTLGVEQVEFSYQVMSGMGGTKSFTTSAQLVPGRYTVLGGVGADPLFVVLEMTRM